MSLRRHGALVLVLAVGSVSFSSACSRREGTANREHEVEATAEAVSEASGPAVVPAGPALADPARGNESLSCEQICAASSKLNCSQARACQSNCLAMASTGVCEPQLDAFFDCLKTQASERWECLEDGTAAIREGFCENEQAAFAQCLHGN